MTATDLFRCAAIALLFAATGCVGNPGPVDTARQAAVASDPAALQRIGVAAEQAGDLTSAEAFYKRAAELRPGAATGQVALARSLAQQGRTDEAVHVLEAAHAAHPEDTDVSALLGRMLIVMRRPAAAVMVFNEGLANAPVLVPLLIGQGVALDATGQHAEAQASYQKVLAQDPGNVAASNNLALSLAMTGRSTESVSMLEKLMTVANGNDRGTVEDNLALVRGLPAGPPSNPAAPPAASNPQAAGVDVPPTVLRPAINATPTPASPNSQAAAVDAPATIRGPLPEAAPFGAVPTPSSPNCSRSTSSADVLNSVAKSCSD